MHPLQRKMMKYRKVMRMVDNLTIINAISRQEDLYKSILAELGIVDFKFSRDMNEYGVSSYLSINRWSDTKVSAEDILLHPWAEITDPEEITIWNRIEEHIDDVRVTTTIRISAELPKEHYDILRLIGKIEYHVPDNSGYETISCGV